MILRLINPQLLLTEVRDALDSYIELLEKDAHELRLLSASLTLDFGKDIQAANQ